MTCNDWNLPWGGLVGTLRWFPVAFRTPEGSWMQILAANPSLMMSWMVNHDIHLLPFKPVVKRLFVFCCLELRLYLQPKKSKGQKLSEAWNEISWNWIWAIRPHAASIFCTSAHLAFSPTISFSSPPCVLWHSLFIFHRNDLVMPSGQFTQPHFALVPWFSEEAHIFSSTPCQKTQVDNLWCFGEFCWEPPCVRQMSRLLRTLFPFSFLKSWRAHLIEH